MENREDLPPVVSGTPKTDPFAPGSKKDRRLRETKGGGRNRPRRGQDSGDHYERVPKRKGTRA